MKELVEVIAKALVDNPDKVSVTETEKEDALLIELSVDPADMGKVIGRSGRIAKAIRTVVKAASSREDKKVIVDIRSCTSRLFINLLNVYSKGVRICVEIFASE